jgi:hypothetical protein
MAPFEVSYAFRRLFLWFSIGSNPLESLFAVALNGLREGLNWYLSISFYFIWVSEGHKHPKTRCTLSPPPSG